MTRTIKAKDIKPGMTIRWGYGDVSYQCPIVRVELFNGGQDVQGETQRGQAVLIQGGKDVLVVKEPQPEEPAEFGAKVRVGGQLFLRAQQRRIDPIPWLGQSDGRWRNWAAILAMGPVQVVPDQGWTVPADTPEVPDRIDEWPESDERLRPYPWRDRDGDTWTWAKAQAAWVCRDHRGNSQMACSHPSSWQAPFTRVTDA